MQILTPEEIGLKNKVVSQIPNAPSEQVSTDDNFIDVGREAQEVLGGHNWEKKK